MEKSKIQLFFASDTQTLTDKIILDIKSNWKNPFVSPIVVFPEFKIQEWFMREWIKSAPNAVVANLTCKTIDSFLFEILKSKSDNVEKLSVDVLTNIMIAYLLKNDNWKKLDDYVTKYLTKNNCEQEIDEVKLFDFANTLSGLFLEYETSRPSEFIDKKGFLDFWNQNVCDTQNGKLNLDAYFFKKNNSDLPLTQEIFQRKLYSEIFHEKFNKEKNCKEKSFMSCAFDMMNNAINENLSEKNASQIRLLTLPYLFKEKNQKFENAPLTDVPIYIFLLSGMGQFYRKVLNKLSETHTIKVYLQNPCMKFYENENQFLKIHDDIKKSEQNVQKVLGIDYDFSNNEEPFFEEEKELVKDKENMLLLQWGKVGRDNIRLYGHNVKKTFFENIERPNDTLLHCIQNTVINRTNKVENFTKSIQSSRENFFKNDDSLSVTACPNKLREIENLYSKICLLLSKDKSLRLDDFLVYAPDIDAYRSVINQVFNQTEKEDKNFVTLPFCIVDSASKNSFTAAALKTLFNIILTGSLNRVDFFSLVRNPVVAQVRSILPEEVLFWQNWISSMNVFRDRQNVETEKWNDEWIKAVKRILLSNFSATEICSSDGEVFLPFNDLNSSDKDSVYKFVDCIESLENWISFSKSKKCYSLDDVKDFLCSWLLLPSELAPEVKKELGQEKKVFKNLLNGIENIKFQFYAGSKFISFRNLYLSLQNSISAKKTYGAKIFANGITFLNFSTNRILPAKYTFLIGLGSKEFPGIRNYKSLDLRNNLRLWPGDDNIPNRNRYTFLCQLMNTQCGFFISYESMDLKKDEQFYVSSVVNDLQTFIKNIFYYDCNDDSSEMKSVWKEQKMMLEENRPYSQLFTSREFRNKQNKQILSNLSKKKNEVKDVNNTIILPMILTDSVFKKFLSEPYKFQTERILLHTDDFNDAPETVLFENIELDALKNSEIRKELLKLKLQVPSEYKTELDVKNKMIAKGILANGIFGDAQWSRVESQVENIYANLLNVNDENVLPKNFVSKIQCKKIEYTFSAIQQIPEWTILSEIPFYIEETNTIVFVTSTLNNNWKDGIEKLLQPYIQVLVLSLLGVCANVVFVSAKSDASYLILYKDKIPNKSQAEQVLRELYKKMYIDNFSFLLPLKFIKENFNAKEEKIKSFEDLKSLVDSDYSGIELNKLLELSEENTGYTDFKKQWNENCLAQFKFVECLDTVFEKKEKSEDKK